MPRQFFVALRCYKCLFFQVQQAKKKPKWECKMCGEKQSLKRNYGIGTAKECRLHIQKLNNLQGELENSKIIHDSSDSEEEYEPSHAIPNTLATEKENKWSKFIDDSDNAPEYDNSSVYLNEVEVVLEVPKPPKKSKYCKKILKTHPQNLCKDDDEGEESTSGSPYITKTSPTVYTKVNKRKFAPPTLKNGSKWNNFFQDDEVDYNDVELIPSGTGSLSRNILNIQSELNGQISPSQIFNADDDQKLDGHNMSIKYVEAPLNYNDTQNKLNEKSPIKDNIKNMFSLCDDEDLDEVLSF